MSEIVTIRFDGDNLQTVRDGERVWVVLKRACEALGINESSQRQKLGEKPWACAALITVHDTTGRLQEAFCVDLDTLPMWLATIDVGRVRPEAREKLIAYQRECARVLRDHFFGRSPGIDLAQVAAVVAEAVRPLADAVAALADSMADLKRRVTVVEEQRGGAISQATRRRMRSEVRSIAALEVAGGRWKSTRAATADLYRDMSKIVGWGGKGEPWHALPASLEQPAFAVLRRRRSDAERVLVRRPQLELVLPPTAARQGGQGNR